jgi:hypothetical protein
MEYLMTYGWAILIIMVVLAVLFYLGVLNPSNVTPNQCMFPPGFTCVTNQLHVNNSLYLVVGVGAGKTIRVNGVACTQNGSITFPSSGMILWSGTTYNVAYQPNVTVPSGSQATLADPNSPMAWVKNVTCTDSNQAAISGAILGQVYNGRIYLNYTETDTGLNRIAVGTYTAKYEP